MVGVVPTPEALRQAREAGLDLVQVAMDSDPPVCKIVDYGKYKYEQAKEEKANRAKSRTAELKEVRLGRSMKIDPHDVEIRLKQARGFLIDGHKVQIVQNFRGREMMHRDRGYQRMKEIVERLGDVSKLEAPPRLLGKRMSMILGPDKAKIDAIKRKEKPVVKKEGEAARDGHPATAVAAAAPATAKPVPASSDGAVRPAKSKAVRGERAVEVAKQG